MTGATSLQGVCSVMNIPVQSVGQAHGGLHLSTVAGGWTLATTRGQGSCGCARVVGLDRSIVLLVTLVPVIPVSFVLCVLVTLVLVLLCHLYVFVMLMVILPL